MERFLFPLRPRSGQTKPVVFSIEAAALAI
jgi:hypothetical protein